MSKLIRKISIGSDYKNEAMHYSVGQQVYGGHCISDILYNEKDGSYNMYKPLDRGDTKEELEMLKKSSAARKVTGSK